MYSSYDKERTRRNCCLKKYAIIFIKFPENVLMILFVGYLAKETGSKIFMAPFKNVIRLLVFEVGVNPINLSSDSCNIDCFFFSFFFFMCLNSKIKLHTFFQRKIWETARMSRLFYGLKIYATFTWLKIVFPFSQFELINVWI